MVAPPDLAADRALALTLTPVSRETVERLDCFVALLLERQQRMNLIAASTETKIWTRHIADSLQLLALAPAAHRWIDLGSGAGFPGLVIACALAETLGAHIDLVESTQKKAAFLREAVAATAAPATVHAMRVEDYVKDPTNSVDIITARALAPLTRLLTLAFPLLKTGAKGLFLKGQDVASELTEASKCWNVQARLVPSRTEPMASIVVIHSLARKTGD
jgi:16S rRNA (guanine527-N7)-methyltransferase